MGGSDRSYPSKIQQPGVHSREFQNIFVRDLGNADRIFLTRVAGRHGSGATGGLVLPHLGLVEAL